MKTRYFKTEGLIISVIAYLEADALLKILSKDAGLISAIAKGSRKVTSKRAGVIQPFNLVRFELYKGKNLFTVVQAANINPYARLSASYPKAVALTFACEVISKTHEEGQFVPFVFELTATFFKFVSRVSEPNSFVCLLGFLLSYLKLIGYRMDLDRCSSCGTSILNFEKGHLNEQGFLTCDGCSVSGVEPICELKAAMRASALLEKASGLEVSYPVAALFEKGGTLSKQRLIAICNRISTYLKLQTDVEIGSLNLLANAIETTC